MSQVLALADRVLRSVPRSTRHKVHAARFGRLVASLRALVELGDDASDKLAGDWILDRSYVASFVQRTLDRAREVVFDASVLARDDTAPLLFRLDAVRADLAGLMAAGPPGAGDPREEPEYRLLRAVIERVTLPPAAARPTDGARTASVLADVLRNAHERALRSFEPLHFQSWGRSAGFALADAPFSGAVRVIDTGGGLGRASGRPWRHRVGWDQVGSRPLRALLEPLAPWAGRNDGPRDTATLAILAQERFTLAVGWPTGALLIDARLQEHAPANFIYCALRGEPPGGAGPLAGALTEGGFRLLDLAPGLTGWAAPGGETETREALGRMGRSLEQLLGT